MLNDDAYRAWRGAEATLLVRSQRYLSEAAYRGDAVQAPAEELTIEGGRQLAAMRDSAGSLFEAWLAS